MQPGGHRCRAWLPPVRPGCGPAGHAGGLSPLEAAREADLGEYAGLSDPERLVGNLHRAYADASGVKLGSPIDLIAAFTDMVIYNGGKPLTCYA